MRISILDVIMIVAILAIGGCVLFVTNADVDTDVTIEGDVNVEGAVADPTDNIIDEAKNAFGLESDDDSGVEAERQ